MRQIGPVLVVALAVAAGCATRPDMVPGDAAPLTRSATPAGSTPSTPADSTTASPTGSPLPPVPTDFRTLEMSGFGVSVTLPVPSDWTREASRSAGLHRTDVDLEDPEVLLRVDLSARGQGTAEAGAVRVESATRLAGYKRLGITPVPDVGDDAVDWTFTFERDGTRQVVDRQILSGAATVAVYYSAPQELYERYLPVWRRAVRDLRITTS